MEEDRFKRMNPYRDAFSKACRQGKEKERNDYEHYALNQVPFLGDRGRKELGANLRV